MWDYRWIKERVSKRTSRLLRVGYDASVDSGLVVGALAAALWLTRDPRSETSALAYPVAWYILAASVPAFSVILLAWRGIYSVSSRYLGLHDFLNLAAVCVVAAIPVTFLENSFNRASGVNAEVLTPVLFAFLSTSLLIGLRIVRRALAWRTQSSSGKAAARHRVLIVGAGDAGETLVRELQRSPRPSHHAVGFVDDQGERQGLRIHGVPVLGTVDLLPDLVERHDIDEIFITMPSALGSEIRRIFDISSRTSARVRTLPGFESMLDNRSLTRRLREVDIEDLLRREPVKTNMEEIAQYLRGARILITGGGGSIGSELARQISRLQPECLILVGKGENSIYEIEQELIQTTRITPITDVADVKDVAAMERIFDKYRPTVVFHAAAHKHVPLMQKNPAEAIQNNILGTLTTAELAVKYGVRKFILISTDKAVNPSSVMGATKRVCEMIVTALGQTTDTQFGSVRFGNVLGSRGSLIPLLKAQIRRGGPVTVTHKDMTRFFMTIPEAVQLVTQAGAIGTYGETFILDMGAPVRIEDLALELIRLHGLIPGDDIEVRYTGVRPGEKLHEELVYAAEDLRPTTHPKIRMVGDQPLIDLRKLKREIGHLMDICANGDEDRARAFLMEVAWGRFEPESRDPELSNGKTTYAG